MDYLQIIPLLSLTAYFFYLTYYYAAPMFRLKVLLFMAHLKYRGVEIRFTDGKITVKMPEENRVTERPLEVDPTSRFFAMTVCSEFRKMLRDIGREKRLHDAEEDGYDGLSTGERACGAGRQRTEENCDRDGNRDAGRAACGDIPVPVNTEEE